MDYSAIEKAAKILRLPDEAAMKEIRYRYRELAMKYHPDRCPEKEKSICAEKFKKIHKAYETILKYCAEYKFSFKKTDLKKGQAEEYDEDHRQRFYENWWGDLKKKPK